VQRLRVLVTDGEQRSALAIVRSLGRAGHEIEVVSTSGRSLAGASRWVRAEYPVPDPLDEPAAFGAAVLECVSQKSIDALIPVTEASLLVLLPLRPRFGDVLLPFANAETFERVSDKKAILQSASELGLFVPEQVSLADRDSAAALSLTFPLVLKPYISVVREEGRNRKLGVVHVSSPAELEASLSALPDAAFPVLAQRRIVGPGTGIFLLIWDGRTHAVFGHRRIREKPPSGGVSAYRESIQVPPEWVDQAEKLLDRVGWRGVAMVEFKIDRDTGRPYLMEVNGRFWGSLQLAIDSGVDFPRLLLDVARDLDVGDAPPYRNGARLRWEWGDVDHLLARVRKSGAELHLPDDAPSRLSTVLHVMLPWRPGERWEVFRPTDPRPFFRESRLWFQRK
jgi:predicted ATP-grasp superfamily ATP-dependent carboligase